MAGDGGRQPDLADKMSQNGVKSLHLLRRLAAIRDFPRIFTEQARFLPQESRFAQGHGAASNMACFVPYLSTYCFGSRAAAG